MPKPKIEAYEFGMMRIQGKSYTKDLIIYPDRIQDSWWREKGHDLSLKDIREILEFRPEILVIGRGRSGRMKVSGEIRGAIERDRIQIYAAPTAEAVEYFNSLPGEKKAVGAFHLTC